MVNPALRLARAIRSALGLEVSEAVRARSDASLWFESLERRVLLSADLSGVAGIAHLHPEVHSQPAPIVRLTSSGDGVSSTSSPPALAVSLGRNTATFDLTSPNGRTAQVVMTELGAKGASSTAPATFVSADAADPAHYAGIYPGIDLDYHHAADGALEYDWVVAPNADPKAIRLSFSGAFGVDIAANGDLELHTAAGDLIQHAPVIYQDVNGARQAVEGRFVLEGGSAGHFEVGFEVGAYDVSKPLIIDPTLGYSTYLGGSSNEVIDDVRTDADGNTYIIGRTTSPDLVQPAQEQSVTIVTAFWAKYDAQGQQVYLHEFSTPLTADHTVASYDNGIQIGSDGTAYILYTTEDSDSTNFTTSAKVHLVTLGEDGNAVADRVVLQNDGIGLGGNFGDVYDVGATGLAIGPDDSLYVSAVKDIGPAGAPLVAGSVIKVTPDSGVAFDAPLPGVAEAMQIDAQGHIYVAFSTTDNNLVGSDGVRSSTEKDSDIYLEELSADGANQLFNAYIGGSGNDYIGGMKLDPNKPGDVYITGTTESASLPALNDATVYFKSGYQKAPAAADPLRSNQDPHADGFIIEVDVPHDAMVAGTFLGGGGEDQLTDIAIDSSGNVYVTGQSNSSDFPVVDPLYSSYSPGAPISFIVYGYDYVIAELDSTLSDLLFSTYFGGTGHDSAETAIPDVNGGPNIAIDAAGTIHIAGTTSSTDFPTLNAVQPTFGGGTLEGTPGGYQASLVTFEPSDGALLAITQRGVVQGVGLQATQGEKISGVVATFANGRLNSTAADFSAVIDWGDGNTSAGTVEAVDATHYKVSGENVYADTGAYVVQVTVTDETVQAQSPLNTLDLSHLNLSESSPAVAQDPNNPLLLAAVSSQETANGLLLMISKDGGAHWSSRSIADGKDGTDGLPHSAGIPDVMFDSFGHLYIAYQTADASGITLLVSSDSGATFSRLATLSDQQAKSLPGTPRLVWNSKRDEIWVASIDPDAGVFTAYGAKVAGSDVADIGDFFEESAATAKGAGDLSLAAGPNGGVAAVWDETHDGGTMRVRLWEDDDGLGQQDLPAPVTTVVNSNLLAPEIIAGVPGIPLGLRPVIAWDNSTGPNQGKIYVAYEDLALKNGNPVDGNFDVYLTSKATTTGAWTEPDVVTSSAGEQFDPTLSVDSSTGVLAAGWYDTYTNKNAGKTVSFVAAASDDGGLSFSGALPLDSVPSDAVDNQKISTLGQANAFGAAPRLAFSNGTLYALWTDNSSLSGANHDAPNYEIAANTVGIIDVVPPRIKISPSPFSVESGQAYTGTVATFTIATQRDVGDFTARIQWGDGTTSDGTIAAPDTAGGPFVVSGTHTYGAIGNYPVWVTITDSKSGRTEGAVSDITSAQYSQSSASITADPNDPSHVFAVGDDGNPDIASGIRISNSGDGGLTWTSSVLGDGKDDLPAAYGSGQAAYDEFGNLFLTYLTAGTKHDVVVLLSSDHGEHFHLIATFADPTDSALHPSIATGPGSTADTGSVWLAWERGTNPFDIIMTAGAEVDGLNLVGQFQSQILAPTTTDGASRDYPSVAVGPKGEVVVADQHIAPGGPATGPSQIVVQTDPDGLGSAPFGAEFAVTTTQIGYLTQVEGDVAGISANATLAVDNSGGEYNGRLYLVYTDVVPQSADQTTPQTQLFLRYSDDGGSTWSDPLAVPAATETNAFLPAIAVDQLTGAVGLGWYGTTSDDGSTVKYKTTISDDGGQTWSRDIVVVAPGDSSRSVPNLDSSGATTAYGHYTGLAFAGGVLQVAWTDNSKELDGNPDSQRFDLANARVGTATVNGPPLQVTGGTAHGTAGSPLENPTLATFTDPTPRPVGQYTATIDWGDGSAPDAGTVTLQADGRFAVSGTHEYSKDGNYTATVDIKGPHTVGTAQAAVTIDKAVQTVSFGSQGDDSGRIRVVRDTDFTQVVATITDGNHDSTAGDYDVTIDWGDGSFSDGVVTLATAGAAGQPNVYSISGTHHYLSKDTYVVQIAVHVKADGTELDASGVIISGLPTPELDTTNDITTALQGVTVGDRQLATWKVDGDIDLSDYTATINWGDGGVDTNVRPSLDDDGGITVSGRHTYATSGVFYASVTLTDDTGNVVTAPLVDTVEPDVTSQVKAVGSGLVYDPGTGKFVGQLAITNVSATDISGPLYVVLDGLPAGVTLTSSAAIDGNGDPLIEIDQSKLSAEGSLAPLELAFSDPSRVPISYSVRVFDGIAPAASSGSSLVFEPNQGQANAAAGFITQGQGYAIGLSSAGASLLLGTSGSAPGAAALLELIGSNTAAVGTALEPQAGVSNYFNNGNTISGVPHFGAVRYDGVYAGIDLQYYGHDGQLEYDWDVHAGADASAIQFRFAGVDGVTVDGDGNLRLSIGGSQLVQRAPSAYQMIDGERHAVAASYVVAADGSVTLKLGTYDHTVALTIDPVLVYSTYLGGSGQDPASAVAVDAAGNTYITGTTYSSDFFTVDPFDPQLNDPGTDPFYFRPDAYITKIDPNGNIVYSSYLGGGTTGSSLEFGTSGYGLAVDAQGRVWIAGLTDSPTFPTTAPPPSGGLPTAAGSTQKIAAFFTQLSADGSHIDYSTVFGSGTEVRAIALDGQGGLYATGPSSVGAAYVMKFDTTAHTVDYYTTLDAQPFAIAVDSAGQAYITGQALPGMPTVNALYPTALVPIAADSSNQLGNAFLTKLSSTGVIDFATFVGGSGGEVGNGVAVDAAGNIVVVGSTQSKDLPVPGGLQSAYGGDTDGFIQKFSNDGQHLLYGTYVGGAGRDEITGVAIDATGRIVFGGTTSSTTLPTTANALQPSPPNAGDPFAQDGFGAMLAADDSSYSYFTYLGGTGIDSIAGVAVDAAGDASFVGSTTSQSLATPNAAQPNLLLADSFITRILAQDDGTITLHNLPVKAIAGSAFQGLVATFTTTGTETAAQFSATIDWGDGVQSAGTISGDFHDGFRITGTHTYAAAGTDDVTVTLRDANGKIVQPAATTPVSGVDTQRYHVSIDTGSIAGSSGSLALLFDPGALPGAPDATLNISNLVVTGGTVGTFSADGGASGDPATSATLQASAVLNRLLGAVTFGTRLDFDIELSGAALSKPAGGNFGSAFALQLLGADGKTPLLGADATGSVLRIDLSPTGSTRATTADSAVNAAALGRATVSNPSTQLALTLQAFSVQEGTVYTGAVGSFTSSNLSQTAGQFSALIDWGDGSDPTSGTITGTAGHFSISGTHTYAVTGNYQLAVTLDDGQGDAVFERSPLTGQGKFQVNPAPLYLSTQNVLPLVADLNGDGLPDVVAADWLTGGKLQVFLNTGNAAFAAAIDLPAGVNANGKLVAGDFNGDGKTDIGYFSVDSSGVRSIGTLLGDGTGHFTAGPAATIVGPSVVSLIATDVDGDGKLDIVAGTGSSGGANLPGEVLILKGMGDGSFQAPNTMTVAGGNLTVIASDVNRDGHPDLVVGSTGVPLLEVLMNDGSGNFTPGATLAVTAPTFFAVTDLNGDGIPDIVAADGDLALFTGVGDGTFTASRQTLGVPIGNVSLIADLNGDGRPELVTVVPQGSSPTALLDVFSEGSDGRFVAVNSSVIANDATALSAEDFNGDGKLDVGVAGSAQLSLFLGRGDATLLAPKALSAPTNDNAATAIDANADGHPDLLAAGNGGVVVNLNAGDGTFALPTPVSIDGAVASTIQLGDVNGDGHADLITGTASGAYLSLGSADGTFGAPTLISTGNVISVALGDVNGDGSMDLALGIAGNGLASGVSNVSIFVNDGHGNFTLRETLDSRTGLTNGVGPSQLVLKDLNGDGKADLVYRRLGDYNGTTFTNSGVAVALSNASGTAFGAPTIFAAGIDVQQAQHGIAVGDVDGDGHLDIVTIASGVFTSSSTPASNGGLFVLHGNGDGTFAAAVPLTFPNGTGLSADSLALADVNRDGHLDIVATRSTSATQAGSTDNTFVLLNDGAGGFAAPVAYAGAINPRSVSVGDLNGDGIPDLVINENQTFDTSGLEVLLGRSDGTFAPRTTYYVADTSDAIAVGDIDGDGKLDVLDAPSTGDIQLVRGRGDGTLDAGILTTTGATVNFSAVTSVDFNGDGIPDLAYTTTDGRAGIMIGRGDGSFEVPTSVVIPDVGGFTNSTPREITLADINGDGQPELVVALASSGAIVSIPLDANGNAGTPVYRTPGPGVSFNSHSVFGDFNGDGLLDVIDVGTDFGDSSGHVRLLEGNANGTFTPTSLDVVVGDNTQAVVAGDLNHDGALDLVFASAGQPDGQLNYDGSLTVMLGNGNGTFQAPVTLLQGVPFSNVTLTDLNGDGSPDIAAAQMSSSRSMHYLDVLINQGDGSFGPVSRSDFDSASTQPPTSLFGVDLAGDGAPEIVFSTGLHVIENQSAQAGINVTNAPLRVTATALDPVTGVPFTGLLGAMHDDNPLADAASHSVSIDWGDGNTSAATITPLGAGNFALAGSHTYALAGTYDVVITAADGHGASATADAVFHVSATAGTLTATGVPVTASANSPFVGTVAHFTDTGTATAAGDYRATIDWGDGTVGVGTVVAAGSGGFDVQGSHLFPIAGSDAVVVRVVSIGGASAETDTTATVGRQQGHPPVAHDDRYVTLENTPVSFDARRNDLNIDGGRLQVSVISGPDTGTLEINPDGSFLYTPAAYQTGAAHFVYQVTDAQGAVSQASVTIDVTAVNTAPRLAALANRNIVAGQTLTVSAQATDPDAGDILTYRLDSAPAGASIDASGNITWLATGVGTDSFVVRVTDSSGAVAARAFKVIVSAAPTPPPTPPPTPTPTPAPTQAPLALSLSPDYPVVLDRGDAFAAQPEDIEWHSPVVTDFADTVHDAVSTTAHPYSRTILVERQDGSGTRGDDAVEREAPPPDTKAPLRVESLIVTGASVHVRFNQTFDVAALSQQSSDSPFTLMRGHAVVQGHFIIDADGCGFSFVVDGALGDGEYTVWLRSGAHGFVKPGGEALDGDANGVAGGDYRGHFRVMSPAEGLLILTGLPLVRATTKGAGRGVSIAREAQPQACF